MRPLRKNFLFATCCVLALGLSGNAFSQEGQQTVPQEAATTQAAAIPASQPEQAALSELPDSPGASLASAQDAQQGSSSQPATAATLQAAQSQATAQDQTQKPEHPVGTAAAEAPKVNGVTAAQPAGVAIAPAKQRRVRTIVLRVGAIVGAGVALGSVIALTAGTSSKPPGAH